MACFTGEETQALWAQALECLSAAEPDLNTDGSDSKSKRFQTGGDIVPWWAARWRILAACRRMG